MKTKKKEMIWIRILWQYLTLSLFERAIVSVNQIGTVNVCGSISIRALTRRSGKKVCSSEISQLPWYHQWRMNLQWASIGVPQKCFYVVSMLSHLCKVVNLIIITLNYHRAAVAHFVYSVWVTGSYLIVSVHNLPRRESINLRFVFYFQVHFTFISIQFDDDHKITHF